MKNYSISHFFFTIHEMNINFLKTYFHQSTHYILYIVFIHDANSNKCYIIAK